MAAYVIADIAGVTDAEKIAAYRELSTRATGAGRSMSSRATGNPSASSSSVSMTWTPRAGTMIRSSTGRPAPRGQAQPHSST